MSSRELRTVSLQIKILSVLALMLTASLLAAPLFYQLPSAPYAISPHLTVTVRVLHAATGIWETVFVGEPNSLTNIGKDFIEQQISGTSNTSQCIYISLSNSTDEVPSPNTWVKLPDEITTDGLDRNTGEYASTGTGTWTVTHTFTAGASFTVRLTGLHWKSTDDSDGNMLAAVAFNTPVTLAESDSLQVTWSGSIS